MTDFPAPPPSPGMGDRAPKPRIGLRRSAYAAIAALAFAGGFALSTLALGGGGSAGTPMEQFITAEEQLVSGNCVMFTSISGQPTAEDAQAAATTLGETAKLNGVAEGSHFEEVVGRVILPDGTPTFVVIGAMQVCFKAQMVQPQG